MVLTLSDRHTQHTSLSMPSRCTALNIREYFQTGKLPASGTVCAPDYVPFERWNVTSSAIATTAGEQDIMDLDHALLQLMKAPTVGLEL